MIDLSFAGYRSLNASIDDPYRKKWDAVRFWLDLPTLPMPGSRIYWEIPALTLPLVALFNLGVNRAIVYAAEPEGVDIWQSPSGTITLGRGDCEDFAILKYAALTKAGVPARVVIGEIKSIAGNEAHAWCAALLDGEWYALDNKFDHLEKLPYMNWLPMAAMHDAIVVRFGREFTINEITKGAS